MSTCNYSSHPASPEASCGAAVTQQRLLLSAAQSLQQVCFKQSQNVRSFTNVTRLQRSHHQHLKQFGVVSLREGCVLRVEVSSVNYVVTGEL